MTCRWYREFTHSTPETDPSGPQFPYSILPDFRIPLTGHSQSFFSHFSTMAISGLSRAPTSLLLSFSPIGPLRALSQLPPSLDLHQIFPCSTYSSALNMGSLHSPKTSVNIYHTTQHHTTQEASPKCVLTCISY
jgi:hypothetical protein